MILSYGGKAFVKIGHGDTTIAINPPALVGNKKLPKSGANIGLISLRHMDFANDEALSYGEKTPFVAAGPGEYEIGGVYVRGVNTGVFSVDGKPLQNTAYTVLVDGISVCHLGGVLPETLEPAVREQLGAVDVVCVPVREKETAKNALRLAQTLLASIIIPLDLSEKGEGLSAFLKEAAESPTPIDKLVLKKKDFDEGDETKIVVLESFF